MKTWAWPSHGLKTIPSTGGQGNRKSKRRKPQIIFFFSFFTTVNSPKYPVFKLRTKAWKNHTLPTPLKGFRQQVCQRSLERQQPENSPENRRTFGEQQQQVKASKLFLGFHFFLLSVIERGIVPIFTEWKLLF